MVAFLVTPLNTHSIDPKSPLQSWVPRPLPQPPSVTWVAPLLFLSLPLCPSPLSLSAICPGPGVCPLLLVPPVYTASSRSRGASLPGEGCGLGPGCPTTSASRFLRQLDTQSQVRSPGAGSPFVPPRPAPPRPVGLRREGPGSPAPEVAR